MTDPIFSQLNLFLCQRRAESAGLSGGGVQDPWKQSRNEMISFSLICVIDTIGYLRPECDAAAWTESSLQC